MLGCRSELGEEMSGSIFSNRTTRATEHLCFLAKQLMGQSRTYLNSEGYRRKKILLSVIAEMLSLNYPVFGR
jgi:hypothetical protein